MGKWSILAALLLSACGGSPTTPSPPPATVPAILPAKMEVVVADQLELTTLDPAKGWGFVGKAKNTGAGCATSVRGTATFKDGSGAMLQAVEFPLDGRVRAGQTVDWQACCVTEANGRASKAILVTFTWQDVGC